MKTIEGFKLRKLGNEYILVGESLALIDFDKMITLNETAAFLWKTAESLTASHGSFTLEELVSALTREYAVSPSQALTDVSETLSSWTSAGIISA